MISLENLLTELNDLQQKHGVSLELLTYNNNRVELHLVVIPYDEPEYTKKLVEVTTAVETALHPFMDSVNIEWTISKPKYWTQDEVDKMTKDNVIKFITNSITITLALIVLYFLWFKSSGLP
jgi:hypothetical protein